MASSRGLGRACAEALAREGVEVVVNGRTESDVRTTAESIASKYTVSAIPVVGDSSTPEVHDALLAACPEPDIVLLNGEGPPPRPFTNISEEDWEESTRKTMISPLLFVQRIVTGMQERRFGRIVAACPIVSSCHKFTTFVRFWCKRWCKLVQAGLLHRSGVVGSRGDVLLVFDVLGIQGQGG